jgi:hypothetical protein
MINAQRLMRARSCLELRGDALLGERESRAAHLPWLNQIASTTPSTTLSIRVVVDDEGTLAAKLRLSFFPEPAVARRIASDLGRPVNAILSMSS